MTLLLTKKTLGISFSILTILSLSVFSYYLKHKTLPASNVSVAFDPNCDLRTSPCTSILLKGGKISFSITPHSIPLLQPLRLQVTTEAINVSKIEVSISGLNMNMGYNHTTLVKKTKYQFNANTTIPVCIRNKMEWEARVLLHTSQGLINVPFRFYTLKQ